MTQNPLLAPVDALINYAAIQPEHIEPAIQALIDETRSIIDKVAAPETPSTWDDLIDPVETVSARLWRAWSVAGHLNAVVNTPELREAYNRCLPQVTEFSTWVGLHKGLYQHYVRLQHSESFRQLTPVRQRIIQLAIRDFRLSGVELEGAAREDYAQISDAQAQVSQKFSENVLDAIDQWSYLVNDATRLDGIPEDVQAAARADAEQHGQTGWRLTLKMPCYLPVMQYAKDRTLRETLYRAYGTLASDQGDPAFDNTALIEQLLDLRAREAQLLGFENFAHMRLETRMADSAEQVLTFLRELADRAKPWAQRDLAALQAFAKEHLGLDTLEPWDNAYVSERLREARYAYSEDEVKQYFTEARVIEGLFKVAHTLFGVEVRDTGISAWHNDARVLEVLRDGEPCGHLMLDLYARQGKQSGAWVDSERTRRRVDTAVQTPVVYLTCNFTPPGNGKPSLLTHDDVITLFHEAGHALHALLSTVDDPGASPFASVEWDAIELPSQFMENFCWEWPVVQQMSAHVVTGEPLPRALYDKLLAARCYLSGMQTLRQIEFSLFDMLIHNQANGLPIGQVMAVLNVVRKEVAVTFPPEWHRFPHNFSHLFAGGYGAGYYSYKWAEVLSADAYAAFEEAAGEAGTLDPTTGRRFRDEVLAVGGARPSAESFRAFRGRDAKIDALLRHSGMAERPES